MNQILKFHSEPTSNEGLSMNVLCQDCLNANCLIKKNLDKTEMQPFLNKKNLIRCKRNQTFIVEGTPVYGLFFIQKGRVKVGKTGAYLKEQILRFAQAGEVIGHRGFATKESFQIYANALEESLICHFPIETITEMLRTVPGMAFDFMLFFAEELHNSETKVSKLAQMSVREKVIDSILYIHRKFGHTDGKLNLQLSRKEIAHFAGTNDEQVTRIISQLKEENILSTEKRKLVVLDLNELKSEIREHLFYLDT